MTGTQAGNVLTIAGCGSRRLKQQVWEKDPLVADAHQLRAHVDHYVVTLQGIVPREAEKQAAELDAWCLSGVKNVVNNIEVRK